ncbi:glycosyltransferase family protein [Escherichia coli]
MPRDDYKIYISIVSHNHGELIKNLDCIKNLSQEFIVVIKNNCYDEVLLDYLKDSNAYLINEEYNKGFGYNNNVVFSYCRLQLNMQPSDYFIVLNPDLVIKNSSIKELVNKMHCSNVKAATINLYLDDKLHDYDYSVRHFPRLYDFILSLVLGKNKTKIDKSIITNPTEVDWCAGSFMALSSHVYQSIQGFDTGYFMYCEDIDLCFRLKKKNIGIIYYPEITGIHKAQHKNRSFFSKHFIWHVKSVGDAANLLI